MYRVGNDEREYHTSVTAARALCPKLCISYLDLCCLDALL